MKNVYYFTHDFAARNDPKLQSLLMEYGCAGIGAYWCIIEMIYEQGGLLPIKSIKSIAFALHMQCTIIESIINDFGLFSKDENSFWSESVKKRIGKREELIDKKKEAARKRWQKNDSENESINADALKKDASALHQESTSNAIKLNKIKGNNNTNVLFIDREKRFYESLIPFIEVYSKDMIRRFYDYWSEPNKSKSKMRFESEKTWDLERRLKRWSNNNFEKNGKTSKNNGTRSLDNKESIMREYQEAIAGDNQDRERKIII